MSAQTQRSTTAALQQRRRLGVPPASFHSLCLCSAAGSAAVHLAQAAACIGQQVSSAWIAHSLKQVTLHFLPVPCCCPAVLQADVLKAEAIRAREEEERGNAMKALENRTKDSKREMDIMEALDEMKSLKAR